MTEIRPFRALRYAGPRDLSRLISPPYDVIPADERAKLYGRDSHNAVRLELMPRAGDEAHTDYLEMRQLLDAWRREGVLRSDPRPALYGLRQRFADPEGRARERLGFFALLRLEALSGGSVRPHERTFPETVGDRLKLLRATDANLSSVLLLYRDARDEIGAALRPELLRAPDAEARDAEGIAHELFRIESEAAIEAARACLAERDVVIADGHHRYTTALAYRDECRARAPRAGADAPFEWILACFANADAPGTLLLPIHRVVCKGSAPAEAAWRERLAGWTLRSAPMPDAAEIQGLLARHLAPLADQHAFAADDGSGVLRILSRPKDDPGELTIRRIQGEIVEGFFGAGAEGDVAYPKSAGQAAQDVRAGRGIVALYLNPLTPDEVFRVTAAGEVLPQKSTFFLPKLPSGLVFRVLGEDA